MPIKKKSNATRESVTVFDKPKTFSELPGKRFEKSDRYFKALSAIKAAKGKWGMVAEFESPGSAAVAVQQLKKGNYDIPEGRFEYASRTLENEKGALFAKYLGA